MDKRFGYVDGHHNDINSQILVDKDLEFRLKFRNTVALISLRD
jgi:hypothetical protein